MLFGLIGGGAKRITDMRTARNTGAAGAAATVTIAAPSDKARNIGHRVVWSYSDNPTGGRLTVVSGATTYIDVDITVGGPGSINMNAVGLVDTSMVVTLAAPGGAIISKLNVDYTVERG